MQFRSSKNDILSDRFWTNMRNVWGIKAIFMAFWYFFQQKGVGAFIRENTLYISLLHYTGIIATSRWIQFQLHISVVFWQASPVSLWACEGADLHVPHTKRTCLARHVVCLNRTLTTFENAMFLSYLRMARWFSPKCPNFSTTYRMAKAQNKWNDIEVSTWKTFL